MFSFQWDTEGCKSVQILKGGLKCLYYSYPQLISHPQNVGQELEQRNSSTITIGKKDLDKISYPSPDYSKDTPKMPQPSLDSITTNGPSHPIVENGVPPVPATTITPLKPVFDKMPVSNTIPPVPPIFEVDRSTKPVRLPSSLVEDKNKIPSTDSNVARKPNVDMEKNAVYVENSVKPPTSSNSANTSNVIVNGERSPPDVNVDRSKKPTAGKSSQPVINGPSSSNGLPGIHRTDLKSGDSSSKTVSSRPAAENKVNGTDHVVNSSSSSVVNNNRPASQEVRLEPLSPLTFSKVSPDAANSPYSSSFPFAGTGDMPRSNLKRSKSIPNIAPVSEIAFSSCAF